MPFIGLVLLIAALLPNFPGASVAQAAECSSYESALRKGTVHYCIERTRPDLPPAPGEPVAYYFHGINSDHHHWETSRFPGTLAELQKERAWPAMTIVSFETSRMSYFIDHKPGDGAEAYETWFVKEFSPWIESTRNLCSTAHCRFAIGHSMGGLGALAYALRNPGLFGAVAACSPALLPYNIFAGYDLWNPYFDRHPISQWKGTYLLTHARRSFATPENFDRHDPIYLVRQLPSRALLPDLYLDVGGQDYYGFQEGFTILLKELAKKEIRVSTGFFPQGSHDIEDEPAQRASMLRFVRDRLEAL